MIPRTNTHLLFLSFSTAAAILIASSIVHAQAEEDSNGEFPILRRTAKTTPVHVGPRRYSAVSARVHVDAVLRLKKTGQKRGCPKGWLERAGGGYICAANLRKTDEVEPRPAARDLPGILDGLEAWEVTRGGSRFFKRVKDIDRRHLYIFLVKGSFLMIRESLTRYGTDYHRNRTGWWATSKNTVKLEPPIKSLGIETAEGETPPAGMIIEDEVGVWESPDENGEPTSKLKRWSAIAGVAGKPLPVEDGWVEIPDRGYVKDDEIARVRKFSLPRNVLEKEKWIAIDLEEQMLHAYVGERLVRVVPCSTGIRNNTAPGRYRIKWKRRLQTMNLRRGHLRVEDVQYVMYYDRRRSIAIHASYWNNDFGKRRSHGCVNLPRDDARWIYDWSTPNSLPEDSENFHCPTDKGTRVIVFG